MHLAVDTLGHLLALHLTAANAQDRGQVGNLAAQVQEVTDQSAEVAFVDQGYSGHKTAQAAADHGIQLEVGKLPTLHMALCFCPGAGSSNAPTPG
jgi:transposase